MRVFKTDLSTVIAYPANSGMRNECQNDCVHKTTLIVCSAISLALLKFHYRLYAKLP